MPIVATLPASALIGQQATLRSGLCHSSVDGPPRYRADSKVIPVAPECGAVRIGQLQGMLEECWT